MTESPELNSLILLKGSKENFDKFQKEMSSFNDDISSIVQYWILEWKRISAIHTNSKEIFEQRLKETLPYQLQSIKSLHWSSFYTGWIEGRLDLLKDQQINDTSENYSR